MIEAEIEKMLLEGKTEEEIICALSEERIWIDVNTYSVYYAKNKSETHAMMAARLGWIDKDELPKNIKNHWNYMVKAIKNTGNVAISIYGNECAVRFKYGVGLTEEDLIGIVPELEKFRDNMTFERVA
jgi:hypothetical protein